MVIRRLLVQKCPTGIPNAKRISAIRWLDLDAGRWQGNACSTWDATRGFGRCALWRRAVILSSGLTRRRPTWSKPNSFFNVKNIPYDRYLFERADVLDVDFSSYGEFDLVLYLGLLYEVKHPIALLEKIARVNCDLLLIDTYISKLPGQALELWYDSRAMLATIKSPYDDLMLYLTKQAGLEIVQRLGYQAIMLKPNLSNDLGVEDYQAGERRAFVCAKQTNLTKIAVEIEMPNT